MGQHDDRFQNNFTNTLWKLDGLNTTGQFDFFGGNLFPLISFDKLSLKHRNICNVETFPDLQTKMFLLQLLLVKGITFLHSVQHLLLFAFALVVCINIDIIMILLFK